MGFSQGGKIVLDSSQSVNMRVNTLAHEIAHELLHQTPEAKGTFSLQERELQAESVAYVICRAVGLEPKSASYLAVYSADKERIVANLQTVYETTKIVLESTIGFR
jgi:Zn-dependent peptidase ImmA (M78 family)